MTWKKQRPRGGVWSKDQTRSAVRWAQRRHNKYVRQCKILSSLCVLGIVKKLAKVATATVTVIRRRRLITFELWLMSMFFWRKNWHIHSYQMLIYPNKLFIFIYNRIHSSDKKEKKERERHTKRLKYVEICTFFNSFIRSQ